MANSFWKKHDITNRSRALECIRGPLWRPKISWTLVHKRLKIRPEFLHTLSILFRPQSIEHALSSINVAPYIESKWNGIGFVCSSGLKPQRDFTLAMSSRLAALNGNASLIATFSSFIRWKIFRHHPLMQLYLQANSFQLVSSIL